MKKKKWIISGCDKRAAENLAREAGLSPLSASVLCARGIVCAEEAREFLSADLTGLHDPMQLHGMPEAAAEIRRAISEKEKIAVYGDYDVDGITATCILVHYLRAQGADCVYHIPNRENEGYGLNLDAIRALAAEGVGLLVTVDTGITAAEEVEHAKSLGMRVVITDHHECKPPLPDAVSVVNPRKACCAYPFPELAGVGVCFKLLCALAENETPGDLLARYGDLIAIGTVADVMTVVSENRIIVNYGLSAIENTRNVGLRMLMKQTGLSGKRMTTGSVSFILAPRINAAGRLGCAEKALEMFLTDDPHRAEELAVFLCEQNKQRQFAENAILKEISDRLKMEFSPKKDKIIVLWGENWPSGVIGIVSSRIADRYFVPAVLISLDGEMGKGSGRSVKGFNLYAALEKNAEYVEKYGGHELAVGLSIHRSRLPEFKEAMVRFAGEGMEHVDTVPSIAIDCPVEPCEISLEAAAGLLELEPFGMGNPQPMFCMENVLIREMTAVGQDKHFSLQVEKDGRLFSAFAFGASMNDCPVMEGETADLAFCLEINQYRGKRTVQMILKDIRCSEPVRKADSRDLEIYHRFKRNKPLTRAQADVLIPSRQDFVSVFRYVKANAENGRLMAESSVLCRRIARENRGTLSIAHLRVCLDVFSEFKIFGVEEDRDGLIITLSAYSGKVDINDSHTLAAIKNSIVS